VPLDATDFYRGLDERFIKRDDMYFLPDQVTEYDTARLKMKVESVQTAFLVTNEKTAIGWLYQLLGQTPMTYQEIQPKFMQQVKTVDRYEDMPELAVLLEENFIQDDKGRWYVPDTKKEGDVAKLREKSLLREFDGYLKTKGKLKLFRSEAIRAGFSKLWKDKNYQAIVDIAERLPTQTVQEDQNLLMYYDISLSRIGTGVGPCWESETWHLTHRLKSTVRVIESAAALGHSLVPRDESRDRRDLPRLRRGAAPRRGLGNAMTRTTCASWWSSRASRTRSPAARSHRWRAA
jgi:hypothetical protein